MSYAQNKKAIKQVDPLIALTSAYVSYKDMFISHKIKCIAEVLEKKHLSFITACFNTCLYEWNIESCYSIKDVNSKYSEDFGPIPA